MTGIENMSTEELEHLRSQLDKTIEQRKIADDWVGLNQTVQKIDKIISGTQFTWETVLGISRPMFRDREDVTRLWAGRRGLTPKWVPSSFHVLVQQAVFGPKDSKTLAKVYNMARCEALSRGAAIEMLVDIGFNKSIVEAYVNTLRSE